MQAERSGQGTVGGESAHVKLQNYLDRYDSNIRMKAKLEIGQILTRAMLKFMRYKYYTIHMKD